MSTLIAILFFLLAAPVRGESLSAAHRLDRALHSVAVATLAVGPRARAFTLTLLQSYVRNAQTDAPLYVVTEDARFFERELQRMQARAEAASLDSIDDDDDDGRERRRVGERWWPNALIRFVLVSADLVESDDPAEKLRQKIARAAAASNASVDGLANNLHMRVKLLKTELLQLVPTQFEFVLYVDSDMVIGEPLRPFLELALRSVLDFTQHALDVDFPVTPNRPTALSLFRDIGLSSAPYHTGVVFMSRKGSRHLLEQWSATMQTGKYSRDQQALAVTVQERALEAAMHLLPTETSDGGRYFAFVNGTVFRNLRPYTFIHATMYRLTQPTVFGFTHDDARLYYRRVLNADYIYDFLDTKAKEALEKQEARKKPVVPPKKIALNKWKQQQNGTVIQFG